MNLDRLHATQVADPAVLPTRAARPRPPGQHAPALERHLAQAFAALEAGRPVPAARWGADDRVRDEARILRLLFTCGPQPAIRVDRGGGPRARKLLTSAGLESGCLNPSLVEAYLDDLVARGLVAISCSVLDDQRRYDAVESDVDAVGALGKAGARSHLRCSLALTQTGRSLCRRCATDASHVVASLSY